MLDQNIITLITSGIAVVGALGGTIAGVVLTNRHTANMERLRIKQEDKKRKRTLLDEVCDACFKIQKLCNTTVYGEYSISEFTFEPLDDIKDRIMHIIIMDFEETLYDKMDEYFGSIKKFETSIEEFHALYVANPTLEDPLIKEKREENFKLCLDVGTVGVSFLKGIQKASQKL
jgi:hypothetical protein